MRTNDKTRTNEAIEAAPFLRVIAETERLCALAPVTGLRRINGRVSRRVNRPAAGGR